MKSRKAHWQVVSLVLLVLAVAGLSGGFREASPSSVASAQDSREWLSVGPTGGDPECSSLMTPEELGQAEFEFYDIAGKLRSNEFQRQVSPDSIVCRLGGPESDGDLLLLVAGFYYVFDRQSGDLLQSHLEWSAPTPAPAPTPTSVPRETAALGAESSATTRVCLDDRTPLAVVEGAYPETLTIWDIMGGRCAVQLGGSGVCFDCSSQGAWHLALPARGEAPADGMACVTARMA
jgi:hypothetical protein